MRPHSQRLAGIIPPMVTPLRDWDTLDAAGAERLVEHLIHGGVHGIFLLGTSGEAAHLSHRLQRELIAQVCRQVAGRIPVLVGITDTSIAEALALARHAADCGAEFVVSSSPYYFPLTQHELRQYMEALVTELPLPLVLYNMPQMTKVVFEPNTVAALLQHERIVGMKDSSGDINYFARLLEVTNQRPDWSTVIGPEELLGQAIRLGGQGGVNGGANILPRLFARLYAALKDGDAQQAASLQRDVQRLGNAYRLTDSASGVIQGMKCALSLLGLCRDVMSKPFNPLATSQREEVRVILDALAIHR